MEAIATTKTAFTDNAGRLWNISVDIASIKRVRAILGIDLLKLLDGKLLENIVSDPVALVDMIYVLCSPQAQREGISDESFGAAMGGDAIEKATHATLEAIINFCPNQTERANLEKLVAAIKATMEKARQMATVKADQEIPKMMKSVLKIVGDSFQNAPESSG